MLVSHFAIDKGKDANEIGGAMAKVTGALPADDAEEHRRLRRSVRAVCSRQSLSHRRMSARTEIGASGVGCTLPLSHGGLQGTLALGSLFSDEGGDEPENNRAKEVYGRQLN